MNVVLPLLAAGAAGGLALAISRVAPVVRPTALVTRRRIPGSGAPVLPVLPVPVRVRAAFEGAGLAGSAGTWWTAWVASSSVAVAVAPIVALGPLAALAVGAAGPVALVVARGRHQRARAALLAPALDRVAAALRAGRSLRQAVGDAAAVGGPLGPELRRVALRAQAGHGLAPELRTWTAAQSDAAFRLAGAALTMAAEVGGGGARAVDGAAASVRVRQSVAAEAAAMATQARASAAVLSLAPIVFTGITTASDPQTARFLTGTALGWTVLLLGVALDVAGILWMRRIVTRAS